MQLQIPDGKEYKYSEKMNMKGGRIVSLSEVSFGRFLSVSDHRKAGLEKETKIFL